MTRRKIRKMTNPFGESATSVILDSMTEEFVFDWEGIERAEAVASRFMNKSDESSHARGIYWMGVEHALSAVLMLRKKNTRKKREND